MTFDNDQERPVSNDHLAANTDVAPSRRVLHKRTLNMEFYERSDGLYEVEARLIDSKTHPFKRQLYPDALPAGEPIHDIVVRLVVDNELLVHDLQSEMRSTPFNICRQAQTTLKPLIGLRIAKGWNKAVREALGGSKSCTHIMELLGPMATTAFQGLAPQRMQRINLPENEHLRQAKVDSCYAYGAQRQIVAKLWPHLHRPDTNI